ncbi:MAG TPA: hypothetical protein VMV31_02810 [Terriglobales bacterium]|nr:hypothetical protein [Terriglobales bacterium]
MAMQHKGKGLALVIGIGRPKGMADGSDGDGGPGLPDPMTRRRQHAADVEAAFTGRQQPHGTFDEEHDGGRVSEQTAGYMELEGAQKSGDCSLVEVEGGVSAERGCCNLFAPQAGADEFRCGECQHFEGAAAGAPAASAAEQAV